MVNQQASEATPTELAVEIIIIIIIELVTQVMHLSIHDLVVYTCSSNMCSGRRLISGQFINKKRCSSNMCSGRRLIIGQFINKKRCLSNNHVH